MNYLQHKKRRTKQTAKYDWARFVLQICQLKRKICSGTYDMNISKLGLGVLIHNVRKLSFIEKKTVDCFTLLEKLFFFFFMIYNHVVFDEFFHFTTICSYISCFFTFHLSIIWSYSKIIHLIFIRYLCSPYKQRSSYWNITWLDIYLTILFLLTIFCTYHTIFLLTYLTILLLFTTVI